MNNNATLQTGSSVIAPFLRRAMRGNPFHAADKEISVSRSASALPLADSRANGVAPVEHVLRVRGLREITAANCHLFRKTVSAALDGHTEIEIDLSQTMSVDCAGLGTLIAVRNLIRSRNGIVRLMNPNPSVQQLLHLMRAGQAFEIMNPLDVEPVEV